MQKLGAFAATLVGHFFWSIVGITQYIFLQAADTNPVKIETIKESAPCVQVAKPSLESLLKDKSIKVLKDNRKVVSDAKWEEDDTFSFVTAAQIGVPLRLVRPLIADPTLYKKFASAIQRLEYDSKAKVAEIEGAAGGLAMHSWLKIDDHEFDQVRFQVIRGDLSSMCVNAYLWDENGKTIIVGKGVLPKSKKRFSSLVSRLLPAVSEIVIDVATTKFRSYIEEEYKNKRLRPAHVLGGTLSRWTDGGEKKEKNGKLTSTR